MISEIWNFLFLNQNSERKKKAKNKNPNMRPNCCHFSLAFVLKFLNFLQAFVGVSILLYSIWMLNQWDHFSPQPPLPHFSISLPRSLSHHFVSDINLPAPWSVSLSFISKISFNFFVFRDLLLLLLLLWLVVVIVICDTISNKWNDFVFFLWFGYYWV